jgi:signal transduction histidine kinase
MATGAEATERRALVLTAPNRDGDLTAEAVRAIDIPAEICSSASELCREIGNGGAMAIVAEEVLADEAVSQITAILQEQPAWSDLPFIILTSGGRSTPLTLQHFHLLETLGNITLLERPVRTVTLLSAVRSALRSRGRQYELRDYLSERSQVEQALVHQAEQLARSNADLQQFAYVTSHDLQEPLRTIASFSQMLSRRYKGKLDGDADEFINFITGGVSRMQAVIEDLLAYSRIVNQPGATFAQVPLSEAVEWAQQNLRRSIEESGAAITCGDLPAVEGDRVELVQLFQNLLSNAIKYRRPDAAPQIHVSAEQSPTHWTVSVADNGIGFEQSYAQQIFVLFRRLHDTRIPGTGIGLAVCRKIVERHGGKIWAESQPGEGATFRFTLSVAAAS